MRKLLIATKNEGKFKEIKSALSGIDFEIVSIKDVGADGTGLVEDGETFEENAKKKAEFFYNQTGLLTLAEDSGIVVDALDGELGVKTRRWGAGESATDKEWIEHFLNRMKDVPDVKRGAKFVCVACLKGDGLEQIFKGETTGILTKEILVPILPGLPLSSCFIPNGESEVYAALSSEEKNRISHRGKAFLAARKFLEDI
ncbi:MAG: non-canonical purine NTP pyrophosphatase [Candidatus Gracilibacteria bacterium]|jgi:XTP/dITP diphosphohydrolase